MASSPHKAYRMKNGNFSESIQFRSRWIHPFYAVKSGRTRLVLHTIKGKCRHIVFVYIQFRFVRFYSIQKLNAKCIVTSFSRFLFISIRHLTLDWNLNARRRRQLKIQMNFQSKIYNKLFGCIESTLYEWKLIDWILSRIEYETDDMQSASFTSVSSCEFSSLPIARKRLNRLKIHRGFTQTNDVLIAAIFVEHPRCSFASHYISFTCERHFTEFQLANNWWFMPCYCDASLCEIGEWNSVVTLPPNTLIISPMSKLSIHVCPGLALCDCTTCSCVHRHSSPKQVKINNLNDVNSI